MYRIYIYYQSTTLEHVFNYDKLMTVKDECELLDRFAVAYPEREGYTVKLGKIEQSINFVE